MMPLTQIACLGLSHHTAPVELRERLSCALPEHEQLLATVCTHTEASGKLEALSEIALLSTCNRVEFYAVIDPDKGDAYQILTDYLRLTHSVDPATFSDHLYFYQGEQAVTHLAHVATGLDSLVLGEPQILGQVSNAYMSAVKSKTAGPVLTALFRSVIRMGKRARSETKISNKPASISSVAISLAQQAVGNLQHRTVLVVGLGEMGQLALNSLLKRGVRNIILANRSRERAEALAAHWNGTVYELDDLPQALAEADVVLSATSAPHTVIDAKMVEEAMRQRPERKLVLLDIAVPRDIEPDVCRLPGMQLFNVDDLQEGLDEALAARQQEIPQVEAVIAEEMVTLEAEMRTVTIRPLIVDLRLKAEKIRRQELERTLRFLGDDLDPEMAEHIHHLSRSLVNKLLHEPTLCLREKATNGEAEQYADAVRNLFALTTD